MSRLALNSLDKDNYTPQLPFPKNGHIKTIKNVATDQYLSVIPQNINDETYAINVNDMCLYAYDSQFELKPCVMSKNLIDPQYFEAKNIINDVTESRYMGSNNLGKKTPFPYTAFKHHTTQQCLTYDNDGLYVAECNPNNIYQRWAVSPDETICLNK